MSTQIPTDVTPEELKEIREIAELLVTNGQAHAWWINLAREMERDQEVVDWYREAWAQERGKRSRKLGHP